MKDMFDLIKIAEKDDTFRKGSFYDRKIIKSGILEFIIICLLFLLTVFTVFCMNFFDTSLYVIKNDSFFQIQIILFSFSFGVYTLISTLVTESFYGVNVAQYVLLLKHKFLNYNTVLILSLIMMMINLCSFSQDWIILYYYSFLFTLILSFYFVILIVLLFSNINKMHDEIRAFCFETYIVKMRKNHKKTKQYLFDFFSDMSKNNLNDNHLKLEDDIYVIRCLYAYFSVKLLNLKSGELEIFRILHKWTKDMVRFLYRKNQYKYSLILIRRCMSRFLVNSVPLINSKFNIKDEIFECFDFTNSILMVFQQLEDINIYASCLEDLVRDIFYVYCSICTTHKNPYYVNANAIKILFTINNSIKKNTVMTMEEKQQCLNRIYILDVKKLKCQTRRDGQSKNNYKPNGLFVKIVSNYLNNKKFICLKLNNNKTTII